MGEAFSDPPQTRSLTARLALALVILLLAGGAVVALAAVTYGQRAADQAYDRPLLGAATQIAESVRVVAGDLVVDMPLSAFDLLASAPNDRVFYAVFAPDGRLLTGDPLPFQNRQTPVFNGADHGETVRFVRVERRFAERGLSGVVVVLVGQTTQARAALASEIIRNALALMAVPGVLMLALALMAVRAVLGPLRQIEAELRGRAPFDNAPLLQPVPREIGRLVGSLNGYMARIARILSTNKRMIAEASHQLRTPIAALRAQAELAAEERDPERLRAIVGRIYHRSIDLSRLTDQLLSRALIIHRADAVQLTQLDLRAVAQEAARETCRDISGLEGQLSLDLCEEPVPVAGDALSLGEACKNLLVNAQLHGVLPAVVAVRVEAGFGWLCVRDAGAGPKGASARAGSGLGLAIAEAVARAHRGSLVAGAVPQGFEVALVLPLEEAR